MQKLVMVVVLVFVVATVVAVNTVKEDFKGKLCFNTTFPIKPVYNTTKSYIDYNKFMIKPKAVVDTKKDFSPKALNFYRGVPSRSLKN